MRKQQKGKERKEGHEKDREERKNRVDRWVVLDVFHGSRECVPVPPCTSCSQLFKPCLTSNM